MAKSRQPTGSAPVWRSDTVKVKKTASLPALACPSGHTLPFRAKGGFSCSPIKCGSLKAGSSEPIKGFTELSQIPPETPIHSPLKTRRRSSDGKRLETAHLERLQTSLKRTQSKLETSQPEERQERLNESALKLLDPQLLLASKKQQLEELSLHAGRFDSRMAMVGSFPKDDATEEERMQWFEKKKSYLLPIAIAETENALKFGNDKARAEAADRVFQMNGVSQRDTSPTPQATIVLQMGNMELPWMPKRKEIVNGTVTVETPDASK